MNNWGNSTKRFIDVKKPEFLPTEVQDSSLAVGMNCVLVREVDK